MNNVEMLRMLADKLEKGEMVGFHGASGRGTQIEIEVDEFGLYVRIDDPNMPLAYSFIENDYGWGRRH